MLYLPYSFFFPAWLSEYFSVRDRTPNLTTFMLVFGMVVSALAMFKPRRMYATYSRLSKPTPSAVAFLAMVAAIAVTTP